MHLESRVIAYRAGASRSRGFECWRPRVFFFFFFFRSCLELGGLCGDGASMDSRYEKGLVLAYMCGFRDAICFQTSGHASNNNNDPPTPPFVDEQQQPK